MVKILRFACAFAILALLIAPLMAVQFNITVTNEIGTRLPGTKVQIMVANTTLYEQVTKWCPKIDAAIGCPLIDDRALAKFELVPGTYFLRLQRSGYPDHVYLQTINDNTDLTLMMFIKKSTYTVFGRVPSDTSSFVGESIKLVDDAADSVLRSSAIKANNYFIIESLWPDKVYHLRVDRGTERLLSKSFSYPEVGAYYMEINSAAEPLRNITTLPTFSGSVQVDLHSKIRLRLMAGERPMAGQNVIVTTPSGPLNLTSDSNGYISVWAAEGGDYIFDWQTLKHTVSVPKEDVPAPTPVVPAPEPTTPNPTANVPPPAPSTDTTALGAVSLLVLAGIGVAIFLVVLVVFGPKLLKSISAKKEHPAGHVFEPVKPSQPPASAPASYQPTFPSEPKHEAHHTPKHAHHKAAKHHEAKHKKK